MSAFADTNARFSAAVSVDGVVVGGFCEDLPTAGYENRFHFLLGSSAPIYEFSDFRWVFVGCQYDGSMRVKIDGLSEMLFYPFDENVSRNFIECAPGHEERIQLVTTSFHYGFWEILIEER